MNVLDMLEYSQSRISVKDLKPNDFQKWVLAFFVKDPIAIMTDEEIIDNMCLTAILDLDIDNVHNELNELKKLGLIRYQDDKPSISIAGVQMPATDGGYTGTMTGRLYFKQKIILPLILAKKEDKVKQIITYLNDNYGDNRLAMEIKTSFETQDQKEFVNKLATVAINQFVPFMNILAKIQERFFGNT